MTYPIAIKTSVVRTRGELGTGALKMKFRDTKKLSGCSYCACLSRSAGDAGSESGSVFCDTIQKAAIEGNQIGLNCQKGKAHIYLYSDDPQVIPHTPITQMEAC